jgi:divalent metal cation (Fe/Co/Zn/Cd) transporter
MDSALPKEEQAVIEQILAPYRQKGIEFHALRTRQAGARRFVSMHILVPKNWTIQRGHELAEQIEAVIRNELGNVTVFTHLEPLGDPVSWEDISLDRAET